MLGRCVLRMKSSPLETCLLRLKRLETRLHSTPRAHLTICVERNTRRFFRFVFLFSGSRK